MTAVGTLAATLDVLQDACALLALGAWCGLAYYLGRMARELRPGLSPWMPGLLWNPATLFRPDVFTHAGLIYRARAGQAVLTWGAAFALAALLAMWTAR